MLKKKTKFKRVCNALDQLIDSSYQSGYLSGAVAAAVGDVVVERRNSGYYVRINKGETDAAKDSAAER